MAFGHCEEHLGILVRPLAWPSPHGAMARGPEQPITWLSTASLISHDRTGEGTYCREHNPTTLSIRMAAVGFLLRWGCTLLRYFELTSPWLKEITFITFLPGCPINICLLSALQEFMKEMIPRSCPQKTCNTDSFVPKFIGFYAIFLSMAIFIFLFL